MGSYSRPDLKVVQGHHPHPLFQLDDKLISAFAVKIESARDLGGDPEYDGDKDASKTTGQESSTVDLHPRSVAISNYIMISIATMVRALTTLSAWIPWSASTS